MISSEQRAAVTSIFRDAGYEAEPEITPVTSEDERIFLVPEDCELVGRRDVETLLQVALRRKVWIVARSSTWPTPERLH